MQKPNTTKFLLLMIICSIFFFFLISSSSSIAMATGSSSSSSESEEATVHIVYTEKPDALMEAKDHHIKTLSSVLGSEEAAKDALVYVYQTAATGFSAKLTAHQVQQLSKQPGVLQVVPSRTVQLHSGGHGIGKIQV